MAFNVTINFLDITTVDLIHLVQVPCSWKFAKSQDTKRRNTNLTINVYVFSERNFSLNLSTTWLKSFKSPFNTAVDKTELQLKVPWNDFFMKNSSPPPTVGQRPTVGNLSEACG